MNLLEYGILANPLSSEQSTDLLQTKITTLGADTFLTLTYPERTPNGDLTYIPQLSNDLDAWREGGAHLIELNKVDQGNGSSLVTVRSNVPVTSAQIEFIRLKIIRISP